MDELEERNGDQVGLCDLHAIGGMKSLFCVNSVVWC